MPKASAFFALAILVLTSCHGLAVSSSATANPLPILTPTLVKPSLIPRDTSVSIEPPASATLAPTTTPTIISSPTPQIEQMLLQLINSETWPIRGLDQDRVVAWEAFARHVGELSSDELTLAQDLLLQWRTLQEAAQIALVPTQLSVSYRVAEFRHESGETHLVLYGVVESGQEEENGEQLFLVARDRRDRIAGLVAAPLISGLRQRISSDGRYVEYFDPKKGTVLLYADARKLEMGYGKEEALKKRLDELYRKNHPYVIASLYPRYFFPVQDVEASFYTLEESLSYSQILQMNEAFALYSRPKLEPLKRAFFGKNTSVIIVERLPIAVGLTYSGTGVVELDRRDLFGNKYYLAEVLAHEGSHVLQGRLTGKGDECQEILRREIGEAKIPPDFWNWTAEELISNLRDLRIGAYHVSLWMLHQLGIQGREIQILQEIIRTGSYNGVSVTPFCKE